MPTSTDDAYYFGGPVAFANTVGFPPGCIGDLQFNPSAPLDATKMKHRHARLLAQPFGVPAVAERRVVHRARAAGVVTSAYAGLTAPGTGNATVTVDVLRNGVSMLTSPVVLGSTVVAYNSLPAPLVASPVYAAGDVIEAVLTVAAGTGVLGQGAFVALVLTEGA